jgi:hypothetical protein
MMHFLVAGFNKRKFEVRLIGADVIAMPSCQTLRDQGRRSKGWPPPRKTRWVMCRRRLGKNFKRIPQKVMFAIPQLVARRQETRGGSAYPSVLISTD